LAEMAQQWADGCRFEHRAIGSYNPEDYGFPSIGENIWEWSKYDDQKVPDQPIQMWYDEKQFYDYNSGYCSKEPCGHYTTVSIYQWSLLTTPPSVQCESKIQKNPWGFLTFFPKRLRIFRSNIILHAYFAFLSTLDYNFLVPLHFQIVTSASAGVFRHQVGVYPLSYIPFPFCVVTALCSYNTDRLPASVDASAKCFNVLCIFCVGS